MSFNCEILWYSCLDAEDKVHNFNRISDVVKAIQANPDPRVQFMVNIDNLQYEEQFDYMNVMAMEDSRYFNKESTKWDQESHLYQTVERLMVTVIKAKHHYEMKFFHERQAARRLLQEKERQQAEDHELALKLQKEEQDARAARDNKRAKLQSAAGSDDVEIMEVDPCPVTWLQVAASGRPKPHRPPQRHNPTDQQRACDAALAFCERHNLSKKKQH